MAKSAILLFGLLLAFQPSPVSAQESAFAGSGDLKEANQPNQTIKDPAEYNAFLNALNDQEPARRALLWEEFLRAYPQSVVKNQALEYLMGDYWRIANLEKAEVVADKLLALNRNHLRALVMGAVTRHKRARTMDPREALAVAQQARALAERGLVAMKTARRPEGMAEQDWERVRASMDAALFGAAGFGALRNKEFAAARDYYLLADLTDVEIVFELALAELQTDPQDVRGFWHVARAESLARIQKNGALARQIEDYGKAEYRKYHGSLNGWENVLRASASAENPPHGFTVSRYQPAEITPAPQAKRPPSQAVVAGRFPGLNDHHFDRDPDSNPDASGSLSLNPKANHAPCDASADALPRTERATPGGVPALTTSLGSDSRAHGVPASVSSPVDGHSHGVPASVTSPGTDCMLNGVSASVASFPADEGHGVPASVTSPIDGHSHGVPASVTSIGVDSSLHGIPASVISPTPAKPLLRVMFGDLHSRKVAAVPVFGAWMNKIEHGNPSRESASPKRQPPGAPAGVRAMLNRSSGCCFSLPISRGSTKIKNDLL